MAFYDQLGSFFVGESEEERRRREEEEERLRIERETPVKQTIEIDPTTGAQKVKIEGSAYNLSASNPLTPTISGPVAPETPADDRNLISDIYNARMGQLDKRINDVKGLFTDPETYARQRLGLQEPGTIAPTKEGILAGPPKSAMMPQAETPVNTNMVPTGAGQTNVITPSELERRYQESLKNRRPILSDTGETLGYETSAETQQAIATGAPVSAIAPTPTPTTATPTTATPTTATPDQEYNEKFIKSQNDPRAMMALASDPNAPEYIRKAASEQTYSIMQYNKTMDSTAKSVNENLAKGNTKDIVREVGKPSEEGSYIKAYLFKRLGLDDLAKEEQEKLGAGSIYQRITGRDGIEYVVKFSNSGLATAGYDLAGNDLSADQLKQLNGLGGGSYKAGTAGSTRVRDSNGNEWSVVPTTRGSIYYDNSGTRGVPVGRTTPITAGSDVVLQQAMANNKKVQEAIAEFGIDAAIKQGLQFQNPITGEYTPVTRSGYNPYKDIKPPIQQAPAPGAPVKQKTAGEEFVPGQEPYRAPGGMPIQGYQGTTEEPSMIQTGGIADLRTKKKLEEKAGETDITVGGKRSESYNKYLDETVAADAKNGYEVSQLRKRQFGILERPGVDTQRIFGLYNAAGESPDAQKGTIVRDIIGGWFGDKNEVSKRLAQLNLDPATRSALEEYIIQNAEINKRTLKSVAGGGSVSDAEQEANRQSNVDVTKIPALGGYNSLAQSQFSGDMAAYKGDWAADQKYTNTLQLEKAWRRESARLSDAYRAIAEERIKWINENNNTAAAVREGYKRFPVPEYDVTTGTWKKTKPLSNILGR